jgi:cysteinyl-tRNA synthetase
MALHIYNTLHRKKERFEPLTPGRVTLYVCGPTVYDSCHIGHARSVVVFDVMVRYLEFLGFEVTYVRNFTDVDDKIINRANETGTDWKHVAEQYIAEFYEDMDALNVRRATVEPRATEHIDDIVSMVEKLISKGHAYELDGDVYFAVDSFREYGKLSGRKLEDMEAGARIDVDQRKHNPFDFALWKSAKPGEPSWQSPWGKGRPGWHIECSAMSYRFLGKTFDIHGGGKDLIFPHHENEIAQSEAAFDEPFARYWIHNGFVNINSEKMSKSLGNFTIIKDVLQTYHPEVIRFFLLSKHYRSPIDFSQQSMQEAAGGLERIYVLLERVENEIGSLPFPDADMRIQIRQNEIAQTHWNLFCEAMDDDFNTARGIGILFDLVRTTNRLLDEYKDDAGSDSYATVMPLVSAILGMGRILGILGNSPQDFFHSRKTSAAENQTMDAQRIETLIREREDARKAKNYARADEIRKELEDQNILLEDRPDGTIWKIK